MLKIWNRSGPRKNWLDFSEGGININISSRPTFLNLNRVENEFYKRSWDTKSSLKRGEALRLQLLQRLKLTKLILNKELGLKNVGPKSLFSEYCCYFFLGGVWQILPRTYSLQCNAFTKPNIWVEKGQRGRFQKSTQGQRFLNSICECLEGGHAGKKYSKPIQCMAER